MSFRGGIAWTLSVILFAFLVTGTQGSESSRSNEESKLGLDLGLVVGGLASLVVLVVVVALCAERRVRVENLDKGPPYWTRSLVFKQEYNGGLSGVSDGINNLSPFHVIRDRLGTSMSDGARWHVGFTEGKHVFEVVWPGKKNRGSHSTIGVATKEVPIQKQGRVPLVGHHSQSWGFGLSSRRAIHANKVAGDFVRQLPDRFFLYLDMDSGKIGFGEDVKALGREALFFGNLVNGIKLESDAPKFLMAGLTNPKESVQIYYIGTATPTGGFDLVPPEAGPSNPVTLYTDGNVTVMTQQQAVAQPIDQKAPPPPGEVVVQADPVPQPARY